MLLNNVTTLSSVSYSKLAANVPQPEKDCQKQAFPPPPPRQKADKMKKKKKGKLVIQKTMILIYSFIGKSTGEKKR